MGLEFSQIKHEFGMEPNISLGRYVKNQREHYRIAECMQYTTQFCGILRSNVPEILPRFNNIYPRRENHRNFVVLQKQRSSLI